MHVVGDDGAAIGGVGGGDSEVVAARGQRFAAGAGRCGCRQGAQVHDIGAGQHRILARRTLQGRVPVAAVVAEQGEQGRRQALLQLPQRQRAGVVGVLQVEVHRITGEHRIGRGPRLRPLAQQQVGPGPHAQRGQAGIDPGGVGVQFGAMVAGEGIQAGLGAGAHAVQAMAPVQRQGAGAEQRGQLAGRGPAHQVHLEIALLRVDVAERACRIGRVAGLDGHRAQRIAADAHRARQAGDLALSVQRGQAAAQQ